MNKKLITVIASGILLLAGCNNEATEQTETTTEYKNEIIVANQDADKFKDRDILSFEILETNRDGEYLVMKIKITNNGDIPINEYCLYFNVYDKDGNKIDDVASYEETVLQPSKSANDELWIDEIEAKDIQLTNYYYNVPNEGIKVDINKELETIDIN